MNRARKLIERANALLEGRRNLRGERKRAAEIAAKVRADRKRKPPEAGIAVPAVPPKGPLPRTGGAEAPLTFD